MVEEALKLLGASLPSTIELRRKISTEVGIVLADPTQLHQVIMNLCTNAHQALGPSGGVLEVNLNPVEAGADLAQRHPHLHEGPYVELEVRDTGPGIDPAAAAHIFEPFFTTKPVGEGTGLGLSVVHGIVSSHDGAIMRESEPGQGTVFRVYLPRLVVGAAMKEELADPAPGGTEHILLVDDEEAIVRLCRATLERLGYRVTAYTSAMEALEEVRQHPSAFDLVLSDVTMSGMTGVEFARSLQQCGAKMPVVLVTGSRETITPEERESIGVYDVLSKPFVPGDLARTLRKAVDAQGLNRA